METSRERFEKLKVAVAMWNALPGDKISILDCARKFCYHKKMDAQPKRWKDGYMCNKCGYMIKENEE